MQLTKGAIGNLINRYKAVLKKCHLMNTFGSLAVAGMLVMGGAGVAAGAPTAGIFVDTNAEHHEDVNITGAYDIGVYAYGAKADFSGKQLHIATTPGTGWGSGNVGLWANSTAPSDDRSVINFGQVGATESINIAVTDNAQKADTSIGVWSRGDQNKAGGEINLNAETVTIKGHSNSGWIYGIYAQNTTTTTGYDRATININAGKTYIDVTSGEPGRANAIVAMSQGVINIESDLYVNTQGGQGNAIVTRGDSIITINSSGTHTVQMNGNVNFNYDGPTSGTKVDADVDITLSGADSYWNGNTLISWNGTPSEPSKLDVSEMTLTVKDGATWTPTAISNSDSQKCTALNKLTLDGGIVDVNKGVAITIENIDGKGAITNAGSVTIEKGSIEGPITFEKDDVKADNMVTVGKDGKTTLTGGVAGSGTIDKLAIAEDGKTTITNAKLSDHEGRALWNNGTLTVEGGSFEGNKANVAGAIYNEGTLTVEGGSFTNNSAAAADGNEIAASNVGGAIYNANNANLSINGTRFEGNTAAIAGAVNNQYNSSHITAITDAVFVNNTASLSAGGALRNQGSIDSIAGTTFEGNTAGNGGALWNGAGGTITSITGTTFTGNKSTNAVVGGGAITNAGVITISATTFTGNTAAGNGGAINNVVSGGGQANIALSSTTFTGNTAAGNGGAIFNAGTLTFNGTNTFTNNTAAGKANDIYNAGTITVAGGTTTLNSGLILAENGTVKVTGGTLDMASGSTLDMGSGTLTINGGTFVADAGLLIKSGTTTGPYVVNSENKVSDTNIAGTEGNLNLRWFDGDYTLGEYTSVKNALLNQSGENAELTLLNARLKVEDGQTLVTGAKIESDGTATLATGAKVVENPDNKPVSAGTNVPHTPENYVSVVDNNNAANLLAVPAIATNGNSITAKGLKVNGLPEGSKEVTLKVTSTGGNNSTLTLVGDSKADTGVIDKDGKALATKAEVDANSTLNMGLTGNTRDQGLTLTEADVTGTLNANGGVTGTSSEYAINALTMRTGSKVNVLDSTMQIGKFTAAGGTMFVDPAYVKIDSVVGDFGTQLLVGSGSTVNIGNMSAAELGEALARAGMSVGPNFTVGAGQSVLALAAPVTLANSGKIVVDANVTSDGKVNGTDVKQAHFGKDSLLVVNGTKINGNTAALTLSAPSTEFTVQNGAKLLISGAQNGKTYKVIANGDGTSAFNGSGYGDSTADGWKGGNLMTSSDMVTLTSGDGMTFTAGVKDARDVFPDLSEGMTNAVNKLYKDSLNNVDSDQMGVRFLSRATDNRFLGMDKEAAAESIESAARIAFAGAAPQMTKMASDAATNAVVNRLGFANPADGAQAMDAEGKIVDRNTTGFALWIAPLWQSQHGWGLDAGNMDYGFNGNLGGVSLGADYTFENAIRAGITFNIGGGYAESSGGDLSSTENRMNFWGLGAYAGWNYENFGVMADVSYTSTWNQLKQDLDSRLGMGNKLEADVQATAISAGLRAEYLLQTSAMDIIPHIGVRYMSLNTWGYDVDTHGGTVLEGDSLHQDIWTFPIGVTFSKDFALDSGWNFKPSLDFTVIPAAGDIKAKHDVHFTGLPGTYEVETQMMDYLTWQGGVGLELANDNMSIGVNYTLQAGQHTTGHGVFGSFRYEF